MRLQTMLCILAMVAVLPATAQKVVTKTGDGRTMVRIEGGAFIPELGVALGNDGDEVKVLHAMPADARPKQFSAADITGDDRILMVNARPLRSAEAFRTLYEATAPGDTIKLGIKRGDRLHIVTFTRMDPKDMPKERRIMIRKDK